MPRSAKIHPKRKSEVIRGLERNGFMTQGRLAVYLEIALSTVNNFINSKPVYISKFEAICEALGLDPQVMVQPPGDEDEIPSTEESVPVDFFAYDDCWVGREKLVQQLSHQLRGSCRLLLIVGLTGIGKTALAERIAVELQDWFQEDWQHRFKRVSFETAVQSKDFAGVAVQWLEEWGINIPIQDRQPEQVLRYLTQYLQQHQVLVLIDSLENLLTGNEVESWGNFIDPWWERFFVGLFSATSCSSRLIVTSQDLPIQVVQQRYHPFWYRQVLVGLEESEQEGLFEKTGFDLGSTSSDKLLLMRLAKAYQGHPLVLRVIIGEIWESFQGSVTAYWHEVKHKIEAVEDAIAQAEADAKQMTGEDDDWKLHKLTRKVRLEVNKQRLRSVFERLATQVPDAYWLICGATIANRLKFTITYYTRLASNAIRVVSMGWGIFTRL